MNTERYDDTKLWRVVATPAGAGILLGFVLAAVVLPAAFFPIADPDVWWIAAAGREMLSSGHVPRENTYSFVDAAHPWIMHEWLHAVPYALGCAAFGPAFFALVAIVVACAMAWLVIRETVLRARHFSAGVAMATLALVLFAQRTGTARPLGSAEVLAVAMVSIAFNRRLEWWQATAAVALELVWANAHGSFPLGIAILAAGAVASRARAPHLVALGGAAVATFVNPYGAKLHLLVKAYATGRGEPFATLHARVLEYAPMWRAAYHEVVSPFQVAGLCALLIATAVAITTTRAGDDARSASRAWLAAAMLGAGIVHARHAELGGLLACVLLMPWMDALVDAMRKGRPPETVARTLVLRCIPVVAAMALLLLAFVARGRSREDWVDASTGGRSFAHLATRIPDRARTYASFRSAGLLIWLAYPREVRPLYDSRNDCYSQEVMTAAFALEDGDQTPTQILATFDRFEIDAALVPDDPLAGAAPDVTWLEMGRIGRALLTSPGWSILASAPGYTLFLRTPQ